MAKQQIIDGLLTTREAILEEIGNIHAALRELTADLDRTEGMLKRHGYQLSTSGSAQKAQVADAAGTVENQAGASASVAAAQEPTPPASPEESLEQIVTRLISENGAPDTAIRVSEWLVRTKQVPNPSPVKVIFEKFPDALRTQYNADLNKAVEALRGQIRTRVDAGTTRLFYESGLVGMTATEAA